MRERIRELKERVEREVKARLQDAFGPSATPGATQTSQPSATRNEVQWAGKEGTDPLTLDDDEPPVVARLIVEIRSDGSRTVARGALKDELSGEQVSLVARGNSPLELALQLTRSLVTAPLAAGQLARAMLARNKPPSPADAKGAATQKKDPE
jgi:hypothetical protein